MMNIDITTLGEFTAHCTSISIIVCNLDDNMVHSKYYNGYEAWHAYDSNGNLIHYKNSEGQGIWYEYDSNNNRIRMYDINGSGRWYNAMGEEISEDEYYANKVWDIRHTA